MEFSHVTWRKASYSSSNGACVEVGVWSKSSYSTSTGDCVEVGLWSKSSYSTSTGDCVEVGLWSKSSYSGSNGQCVEVSAAHESDAGLVCLVRDSKDPAGGCLVLSRDAWSAFVQGIKLLRTGESGF
jgi:hypothetical protein